MKKALLVSFLLLAAGSILYVRYQQVFREETRSERRRSNLPEDLPPELKASPIAKIRKGQSVSCLYATNGFVYCGGPGPSLEAIEIDGGFWGRGSTTVSLPAIPKQLQGIDDNLIVFFGSEPPITLDISDPSHPRMRKAKNSPLLPWRFTMGEGLLLEFKQGGVPVHEIDSQGEIREVGVYPVGHDWVAEGAIRDRKAYLCAGRGGLQIVDLTYPFSPVFETLLPIDDVVIDACFVGDYLVVCLQGEEPRVYDWREGCTRDPIGELEKEAQSCVAYGSRVFLGYSTWAYEYDFSDPESPMLTKVYPGIPNQFAFWEDNVLISRGDEGVWIYRLGKDSADTT